MAHILFVGQYKEFEDLPSPIENETQILTAINAAEAFVQQKTGRSLECADCPSPSDAVETLDGNGTSRLYTREAPVTVLTKLEYWDGTAWQEYDSVTYPYTFKADSNIIYFTQGHKFYKGHQNIRATFEFGFATMPKDLKLAVYLLAKYIINESDRQGLTKQSDGEQQFWYEHKLPPLALEILARYRTVW